MAESPDMDGATAAVSQLTSELVKLTTTLRHHLKVMRRAPHEVQCFLMETSNFTCLLNSFTELADRPLQNTEKKEQRKREKMVFEVEQQCAYVRDKMEYLVDRFAVLAKGNMTPLEGLLERIKYLLNKPDVKDLRLSLQLAALTVNCLSTLFAWEEATMKNDTRTVSLLEQLKNLLPMAKKASTELAEYQRKHGTTYESGVPDPNNAMLAASEEILRQIAHAIRPRSRSDVAKDQSSDDRRRERRHTSPVVERTSQAESWSSPFGPDGLAADTAEYMPRRNRVSFKTSNSTIDRHFNHHNIGTSYDHNIAPVLHSQESKTPPAKPPNPATEAASHVFEEDLGGISSDKDKQEQANNTADDSRASDSRRELRSQPSIETYISETTQPHIHTCTRRCPHIYCSKCNQLHCSHNHCPLSEKPVSKEPNTSTTRPMSSLPSPLPTPSELSRAGSREDTTLPQMQYSLPAPTESEESGLSDREMDPHWSRTNLAQPSSKSSSPSTRGHGSPKAARRRRNSTAVRAGENAPQEKRDARSGVPVEAEKQTQEQTQRRGSDPEGAQQRRRRLDGLDTSPVQERRRQQASAAPRISEDREPLSGEGRPGPYVPDPPSSSTSGRRRPRRPRPKTMML
ncbi:hypothetical protein F5Y03DRAFT_350035 [Xylaria venustula]|nr:hypothetical protein F5Y03DRAFT_350035 [Xylaria venustula]